jgi:hypothetical protein
MSRAYGWVCTARHPLRPSRDAPSVPPESRDVNAVSRLSSQSEKGKSISASDAVQEDVASPMGSRLIEHATRETLFSFFREKEEARTGRSCVAVVRPVAMGVCTLNARE